MELEKENVLVFGVSIAFLIALLVLGIVFIQINYSEDELLQESSINQTEKSFNQESQNIIYFTDSGFTPLSLTIEGGEKVTFVNNASNTMWVGSDQHPTHTQYDGTSLREHCNNDNLSVFDQCKTGDKYSFTFNKKGTFGYHNHQPFVSGGEITVK